MSGENSQFDDMLTIARAVFGELMNEKSPQEIQAYLVNKGVDEANAHQFIGMVAAAAQAACPVLERKKTVDEATQELAANGFNPEIAGALVNMVVETLTKEAQNVTQRKQQLYQQLGVKPDEGEAAIKLARAVLADLDKGVSREAVLETLQQVDWIDDKAEGFIDTILLAQQAATRIRGGEDSQAIFDEFKIIEKPPYVSVLVFAFVQDL